MVSASASPTGTIADAATGVDVAEERHPDARKICLFHESMAIGSRLRYSSAATVSTAVRDGRRAAGLGPRNAGIRTTTDRCWEQGRMKLRTLMVAGAMLPLGATAQDLDYTFVEAAYVNAEMDAGPFDIDGDGLELRGSVLITDTVFLIGEYASYDYDRGVDVTDYSLGAGMRWGLKPELDLVGDIGWLWREIDRPPAPDIDDDGFQLGVGLRARVHDAIEVQAGIRHI